MRAYVGAPRHGFEPEPYRLADYTAYYRLVQRRLERALAIHAAPTYPEPVMRCEVWDHALSDGLRTRLVG